MRDAAQVQGDIHAAGFSVHIADSTGGDLTAMGNTVNLASAAPVTGNLRFARGGAGIRNYLALPGGDPCGSLIGARGISAKITAPGTGG